jgi:hypothetical protein
MSSGHKGNLMGRSTDSFATKQRINQILKKQRCGEQRSSRTSQAREWTTGLCQACYRTSNLAETRKFTTLQHERRRSWLRERPKTVERRRRWGGSGASVTSTILQ